MAFEFHLVRQFAEVPLRHPLALEIAAGQLLGESSGGLFPLLPLQARHIPAHGDRRLTVGGHHLDVHAQMSRQAIFLPGLGGDGDAGHAQ